jgi:DNA-binding transcriptional MerR regulator
MDRIPVDEAAKRVGLSRNTIFRYIAIGLLKRYTSPLDRKTYVDLDELKRLRENPPFRE